MSAPTPTASPADQNWSSDLASFLGPGCFPTTHDHLAATLISRHAPSHLLWHLSVLPRTRQFHSVDELVEALAQARPPSDEVADGTPDP
jgi:hypothetical protein